MAKVKRVIAAAKQPSKAKPKRKAPAKPGASSGASDKAIARVFGEECLPGEKRTRIGSRRLQDWIPRSAANGRRDRLIRRGNCWSTRESRKRTSWTSRRIRTMYRGMARRVLAKFSGAARRGRVGQEREGIREGHADDGETDHGPAHGFIGENSAWDGPDGAAAGVAARRPQCLSSWTSGAGAALVRSMAQELANASREFASQPL